MAAALPLKSQNSELVRKAEKIDLEILRKAQATKKGHIKMLTHSMFQKRSKSTIKAQSNLFKERSFDPEPILRERIKECTFKPSINDTQALKNYVPIIDRTFPKKEVNAPQDDEKKRLDDLIREQGSRGRQCLPADEWMKKDKVILSETHSVKEPEEEEVKGRRGFNPNFYKEQWEWLKGIHKRIREEQLSKDESGGGAEVDPTLTKTKEMNAELMKANLAFFDRIKEVLKHKKDTVNELEKEAYNYPFKPNINPKSREIADQLSKTDKLASTQKSRAKSKEPAKESPQILASLSPRPDRKDQANGAVKKAVRPMHF